MRSTLGGTCSPIFFPLFLAFFFLLGIHFTLFFFYGDEAVSPPFFRASPTAAIQQHQDLSLKWVAENPPPSTRLHRGRDPGSKSSADVDSFAERGLGRPSPAGFLGLRSGWRGLGITQSGGGGLYSLPAPALRCADAAAMGLLLGCLFLLSSPLAISLVCLGIILAHRIVAYSERARISTSPWSR